MSSEQGVPSPAAAVLARRQSRTTPQKRAQGQVSSGGESETGSETGQTSSGMQTMIRFVTMDTMKTRVWWGRCAWSGATSRTRAGFFWPGGRR